ncbi:PQQ-binding-like beta-propeller repeat protein [Streptomyces sp. NPDC127038]|uniref:PQQ-binding-like beta-propeller repeat protein n=1 Tax=Streptomyces sp. NPDC127038 TaxID=3347114 RepID=UPI003668D667
MYDHGREQEPFAADAGIGTSPVVGDGVVCAVDAETSEERRRLRTGGEVTATPVVAGGTVYVSGEDDFRTRCTPPGSLFGVKFHAVAVGCR